MIPTLNLDPVEVAYSRRLAGRECHGMVTRRVKRVVQRVISECIEDDEGCWVWQGHVANSGYGKITGRDDSKEIHRTLYVHRITASWFWMGVSGDVIPSHMWGVKANIDHDCQNKLCVKPDHLYFVSHKANNARGESNTAKNQRKTGCPKETEHGPYDKVYPNGHRYCSKCKNEKEKRHRQRLKDKQSGG